MTSRFTIPARSDPCWRSVEWRRETLRNSKQNHGLSCDDIADLTGVETPTVEHWMSVSRINIGVNTLRSLLLELNTRAG